MKVSLFSWFKTALIISQFCSFPVQEGSNKFSDPDTYLTATKLDTYLDIEGKNSFPSSFKNQPPPPFPLKAVGFSSAISQLESSGQTINCSMFV